MRERVPSLPLFLRQIFYNCRKRQQKKHYFYDKILLFIKTDPIWCEGSELCLAAPGLLFQSVFFLDTICSQIELQRERRESHRGRSDSERQGSSGPAARQGWSAGTPEAQHSSFTPCQCTGANISCVPTHLHNEAFLHATENL